MILCALLNPCCLGTLSLDQRGVSWTSNSDINLIRFPNPNFKGLSNRDRMPWDCVEIKTVQHASYQEVQAVTGDDPSGTNTAT